MIGKISGKSWSEVPAGTTHLGIQKTEGFIRPYKKENGIDNWCWFNAINGNWVSSDIKYREMFNLTSKEEDLELNTEAKKEVKGFEDLEVGMFLKDASGDIRVVVHHYSDGTIRTCNISAGGMAGYSDNYFNVICLEWSYTYNGPYTLTVKESEKDKKLRGLEESANLIQQQIKELKGTL